MATTIGLALQACYLATVPDKLDLWKWVVTALAISNEQGSAENPSKFPLTKFIAQYLYGRDAVALSNIKENLKVLEDWWLGRVTGDADEHDAVGFWIAVALVEIGDLEAAQAFLAKYRPKNTTYLFGIHLGCVMGSEIRYLPDSQKKIAVEISKRLTPKVELIRLQFLEEFKTELLEIQQGRIAELERDISNQKQ